ncbi:MAG: helix-turn-helix transcriptional regulator [Dorea sp.]|nr:helix-turn-helix transcriptional regulator [Dorea sp.]
MSFANKLKILRTENRMTQQDVADHLNVARSTVAGYETKNRQPSHEKLTTLANLFRVTIDYLLDDETINLDSSQYHIYSEEEKRLISKYRRLTPVSKKRIIEYVHLLELSETEER